jgi:hypothetical protein
MKKQEMSVEEFQQVQKVVNIMIEKGHTTEFINKLLDGDFYNISDEKFKILLYKDLEKQS